MQTNSIEFHKENTMVIVSNNWRLWAAGMAASLVIFAVVFFAVIKPSNDTANQAIKSGIQQSQQVLNQAQKQLSTASGQSAPAGQPSTPSVKSVQAQGQKVLSKAQQLTQCTAAAGTDPTKLQACAAKFGQ
jgi:hypothetical protein